MPNVVPYRTRSSCSDCGGITNPIGKWVDVKLQPVAQSIRTYIRDSFEFKRLLREHGSLRLRARLFTFDTVSIYTNISTDYALEIMYKQLSEGQHCTEKVGMGHGKGHFGPFPLQTPSSFHFPCQPLSNTLFFRHFPPLQRPIQKKLTFRHSHPLLGPPSPICGPIRPPLQRRLPQKTHLSPQKTHLLPPHATSHARCFHPPVFFWLSSHPRSHTGRVSQSITNHTKHSNMAPQCIHHCHASARTSPPHTALPDLPHLRPTDQRTRSSLSKLPPSAP